MKKYEVRLSKRANRELGSFDPILRRRIVQRLEELQDEVAEYLNSKPKEWTNVDNHFFRVTFLVEEVESWLAALSILKRSIASPTERALKVTKRNSQT